MNNPNYKTQFDKITVDYISGNIKPYDSNFCFCGTLNHHCGGWQFGDGDNYSEEQFYKMEEVLLKTIAEETVGLKYVKGNYYAVGKNNPRDRIQDHQNFENALFNGMCAALNVLKQIHIERGEVIDEVPVFKKRELQTSK